MHHGQSGTIENAAYIAIGADRAFEQFKLDTGGRAETGGHVEYIMECIAHAEMLEKLYQRRFGNGGCAGVFAYEVAENFGFAYGGAQLRGEHVDAKAIAEELADRMESHSPREPYTWVCEYCGSDNVTFDAPAQFNKSSQEWELVGDPYDDGFCRACFQEIKGTQRPLTDEESEA